MNPSGDLTHFVYNGFLIIEPLNTTSAYYGVYGWDWPIEDYLQIIETLSIPMQIDDCVRVARNWTNTYEYWQRCRTAKLDVRLLLLETAIDCPTIEIANPEDWQKLGYDVACINASFYSAVEQELVGRNVHPSRDWTNKLNEFGLFNEYTDALDFFTGRLDSNPHIETVGDFAVIRVSRYKPTE